MKDTMDSPQPRANAGKFRDPERTATGTPRAKVALSNPDTLWFNTGTLCNIACVGCYIESSPKNDALVYLTVDEVEDYLNQLDARAWNAREIGFTGGEPFMNPQMIPMLEASLKRGYQVLILTNAMQPMMRPKTRDALGALIGQYRDKLTFRISLDHHSAELHDSVRGRNAFERSLQGMRWLRDQGAEMAVAGRTLWNETEADCRAGFAAVFKRENFEIDANNPGQCVLFPEMDETVEVPEITTECWSILNKHPDSVMCSSSRMVVRRKGSEKASVLACTLLPYDPNFELGHSLEDAEQDVSLNHPHCAKFCVLGGASCSA